MMSSCMKATVRLMDAERLLLVVKDLQYDDKFFRGRFAHYAKDTATLPRIHPMKSAGGWRPGQDASSPARQVRDPPGIRPR